MSVYYHDAEQFLPIDIFKAWDFFSDAKNLSVITPPEMDFKILTDLDNKGIYKGMLIDYTVKPLFGIPVHWQTEIFKKFSTDQDFQRRYKEFIFDTLWNQQGKQPLVNP